MRVAVVGTGTGIGKTHTTLALLHALVRRGERALGLKPIESGFDELAPGASDGEQLARASSVPALGAPPVRLRAPLTPWLAAEREGETLDLELCVRWIDAQSADYVLVETAGGLLSPLTERATNLDLVRSIAPDVVVLVAPDRLGVLHDVTACRLALERAVELPRASIVLELPERSDASTGANAGLLERLGYGPVLGTLPRGAPDDAPVQRAASAIIDALRADPARPTKVAPRSEPR
jgi:dethiobiotin synthetase